MKKSDLLIEFLIEEMPAHFQPRISAYAQILENFFNKTGQYWVSPQRMAFIFSDIPTMTELGITEVKGPKTTAPQGAIDGFLRAQQCTMDDLTIVHGEKGDFYVLQKQKPAVPIAQLLPELLGKMLEETPLPKSMRFNHGNFAFIRPLRGIMVWFDGGYVNGSVNLAGREFPLSTCTMGHRLIGQKISGLNPQNYQQTMRAHHILVDWQERRAVIGSALNELAKKHNLTLIDDEDLLDETTGLVEYPAVLMGSFDAEFLALPAECLIEPMRGHQKYFCFRQSDGTIARHFALVSNQPNESAHKAIIAGNERVLRARLADAAFFWQQDLKMGLDQMVAGLKERAYFKGLGTIYDKCQRVAVIAQRINKIIGITDDATINTIAHYMKADLTSAMVGEFPALQGVMIYHYAKQRFDHEIAEAMAGHYLPTSEDGALPANGLGQLMALADRLDSLQEFFRIGVRPTGSNDPYALRRAALGVIRILALDFGQNLSFEALTDSAEVRDFLRERLPNFLEKQGIRGDIVRANLVYEPSVYYIQLKSQQMAESLKDAGLRAQFGRVYSADKRTQNIMKQAQMDITPLSPAELGGSPLKLCQEMHRIGGLVADAIQNKEFTMLVGHLAVLAQHIDDFFTHRLINDPDLAIRMENYRILKSFSQLCAQICDFRQLALE